MLAAWPCFTFEIFAYQWLACKVISRSAGFEITGQSLPSSAQPPPSSQRPLAIGFYPAEKGGAPRQVGRTTAAWHSMGIVTPLETSALLPPRKLNGTDNAAPTEGAEHFKSWPRVSSCDPGAPCWQQMGLHNYESVARDLPGHAQLGTLPRVRHL